MHAKCNSESTTRKMINEQASIYQRGFMCVQRLWITFTLVCQDILMWAFSWKRNHGIHERTGTHTRTHTHTRKKKTNLTLFVSRWVPPICCCLRGRTLLWDTTVSSPTSPPYKPTIALYISPSVHLEPVCASPGCPCPVQTNKTLQQWGRDGG